MYTGISKPGAGAALGGGGLAATGSSTGLYVLLALALLLIGVFVVRQAVLHKNKHKTK